MLIGHSGMRVPGTGGDRSIPSYVPPELVFEPDYEAPNTLVDPFSVTAGIYDDLPPVFYWPRPLPGRYDGTWVVTRYSDIREVYQNDALYSSRNAANFQATVGETFQMLPQAMDAPAHAKYRALLNPWFSPKAVTALEPYARQVIEDLIDSFIDKGICDAAYDFGRLYPVRVFLHHMGLPQDKFEDFLEWEYAILHDRHDIERIRWGARSAIDYLRSFAAGVRQKPDQHLTSAIVHGQINGRSTTDDEIIGMMFQLWMAGLDTVAGTSSLIFRRLALDIDMQQMLRENPDRIPNAIEEFVRMQPLVNSSRQVKEDHEIRGIKIKAGDHVLAYNLAGNFDPEAFANPREALFDRSSNRHFSFAGGRHFCLGAFLARRELAIAVTAFLRRVPTFRMKPNADMTAYPGLVAAPRVPVIWDLPTPP
ncbi:cytochrome P450 [Sphingobium sp. SCG-1]|uniref:cytochrome P450 n=1 Tax=Sphingobium sp. SCG-1 TaxID=2072936 RepID=UPI000CD6B88D|nr:cytochrome P450 [Sphingobium sp. SCG-1]AUW59667.1 cytochrome P450 [Sphingobium sp. SCG-1]